MKRFLLSAIALLNAVPLPAADVAWVTARHEYKKFPLFLRYPASLAIDELQSHFPMRIVATLKFSSVTDNGLPEAAYNRSLEGLDEFIVRQLSSESAARCVLVETFGGKRIYYAYAKDGSTADFLKDQLRKRYPKHDVTVEGEPDAKWSFIRNYAEEFKLFVR